MEKFKELDAVAKLFPSVTSKNNSSVFRVSIVLKEEIDPRILQLAVNMIYERFHMFFLRLRKGVFWNYFDENIKHFTVEKEEKTPCSAIISHENKGYIVKVLYFGNRISIETFHSVADGSGVVEFMKSLVYYYLTIKHGNIDSQGKVLLFDEFDDENNEDSFNINYSKATKLHTKLEKKQEVAFRNRGKKFAKKGHRVISGVVSVAELKQCCKEMKCSITALLIANMIVAIYEGKQKNTSDRKPIVVAVPVNLRNVFQSKTLKNFFGVVNIGYKMNKNTKFHDVIASVAEQLKVALDETQLKIAMKEHVELSTNVFSRHTPLVLKNLVIPVGFRLKGEVRKTITLSNLGRIDLPDDVKPYIEHTEVLVYPTEKSQINCGVCSFEDKLVISFTSAITDTSVIREFFTSLARRTSAGVSVYSNSWGDANE